jgi:hypothetical protein
MGFAPHVSVSLLLSFSKITILIYVFFFLPSYIIHYPFPVYYSYTRQRKLPLECLILLQSLMDGLALHFRSSGSQVRACMGASFVTTAL